MAKRAAETYSWDTHKDTIHKLYMEQEKPLREVIQILEAQFGFKRTKAQYERNLNNWGWRRKLKAAEWRVIEREVEKRKTHGKGETDLQIQGIYMPRKKIQRGVARHQFQTTLEAIEQKFEAQTPATTSRMVRISSPPESGAISLHQILDEAYVKVPWIAFQAFLKTQFSEDYESEGSNETPLLVVRRTPQVVPTIQTDPSPEDWDPNRSDFFHWADEITFNMFVNDAPRRFRLVDLTQENPLPFLPFTRGRIPSFRPELVNFSNITSRTVQLRFFELAVGMLSNGRTDGSVEHILVDLCSTPRNLAMIKRLLSMNLISTRNLPDHLLLPAVQHKNIGLIKALIKAGANPCALRWREDTLLSRVTQGAHLALTREGGTGGIWRENVEDSALSLAAQMGEVAVIHELLQVFHTSNVDEHRRAFVSSDVSGFGISWAIMKAMERNHSLILRRILEPEVVGNIPEYILPGILSKALNEAIFGVSSEAVPLLLDRLEEFTPQAKEILNSALVAACRTGQVHIVQDLFDRGAELNPSSKHVAGIEDKIPLSAAVQGGHASVVEMLLKKGADPNMFSKQSAVPILVAAAANDIEIARMLLEAGADPNQPASPNGHDVASNRSAIKWALVWGSAELFFLLIKHGATVEENMPPPHDSHTILALALLSRQSEIIDYLLEQDLKPTDALHDRSFQLCVMFKDLPLIERFVSQGATIASPGALCVAVYNQDTHLVHYLLREVEKSHQHLPSGYGAAGLALATQRQNLDMIKLFLSNRIQPFDPVLEDVRNVHEVRSAHWDGGRQVLSAGTTAFNELARTWTGEITDERTKQRREDQIQCLELLLDACRDQGFSTTEQKEYQLGIDSLLRKGTVLKDWLVVQKALEAGANCYARIADNLIHGNPLVKIGSALDDAAENGGDLVILTYFIRNFPENDNNTIERHQALDRALIIAATSPDVQIDLVRLLLDEGADANFSSSDALKAALEVARIDIAKLLLENGANYDSISYLEFGKKILRRAVRDGDVDAAKSTLQRIGADISHISTAIQDKFKQQLSLGLQEAVEQCNVQMIEVLIAHGADVNARPGYSPQSLGGTAVQLASRMGHFEILRILLDAGGDINAPRTRLCGRTALEGAAEEGFLDMVRYLLEIGAEIEGRDNRVYRRSVYRAWHEGHTVIAEMIQDFKKARYGIADCASTKEIIDSMDPLELEIERWDHDQDMRYEILMTADDTPAETESRCVL
ncbi:ankyrin [Lophiostoma macrostomum CBS 122681]|uniref:Ankyrin n=1 Tax=Lophiostoma macrostomum CBS 122681 TaxID=1314788 RepID=A0A6A6TKL2_9PLEO|nr:ankyrin [Lophiostoma macrostomum CBS 122681]